uniref:Uncharacterized protein n=1 Tax=Parascaris equorum TaxID=6256 RepID=A0A914R7J1_PAREQ
MAYCHVSFLTSLHSNVPKWNVRLRGLLTFDNIEVLDSSDVGFRKRVASKSERKWPRKDSFGREGKQRSPNAEAVAKSNIERCNFFEDDQVQKTGSIFEHRKDMQFVKSALPACRLNGFHIKCTEMR